jgi:hypothetical protein
LKQSGIIYRIIGNKLFVQGFKKPFRVEGLEQIPEGAERANAKLGAGADWKKRRAGFWDKG